MKLSEYRNSTVIKRIIILMLLMLLMLLHYGKRLNLSIKREKDDEVLKLEESILEYRNEMILINDVDGNNTNYEFIYKNETFKAVYTIDNWKIYNSYKIEDINAIKKICQSLIDIHPIHGKDMISYRNAQDMAYEWLQHNIAYRILPKNHEWKNNAKDVDFDPRDQGKNLKEIYEDRIGKSFNNSLNDKK